MRTPVSEAVVRENLRLLAESEPQKIAELVIEQVSVTERDGKKLRKCKVGHANKVNGNNRIYPASEWTREAAEANERCPKGLFAGAVNHPGWTEGGDLDRTVILWERLWSEGDAWFAEFSVIEKHSAGADFVAQMDAGLAVGFSTYGYARARKPTSEEREKWGLGPEADDYENGDVSRGEYRGPLVMFDWDLRKIDAVTDPSVRDARLMREAQNEKVPPPASTTAGTAPKEKSMTLDELKDKDPALFALHEQAVKDAVAAKESEAASLKAAKESYDALRKQVSDLLTVLADKHGCDRPFKEITDAEASERIAAAEKLVLAAREEARKQIEALADERDALKARAETAENELRGLREAKADADRRAAVEGKLDELLRNNEFAEAIRESAAGEIAKPDFTAEKAEAFVQGEIARIEKLAKVLRAKAPEDKGDPFEFLGEAGEDEAAGDNGDPVAALAKEAWGA